MLSYRRYGRETKLVRHFSETLRLFEKVKDEATSGDPGATTGALGVLHRKSAVLSSADEYDVLLYSKAAAAHARNRKQIATFNGKRFHFVLRWLNPKINFILSSLKLDIYMILISNPTVFLSSTSKKHTKDANATQRPKFYT